MPRPSETARNTGFVGRKAGLAASTTLAAVLFVLQSAGAADSNLGGQKAGGIRLAPADADPVTGRWLVRDDISLLSLDLQGRALLVWDNLSINAEDAAYLSLYVEGLPTQLDARVVWRTSAGSEPGTLVLPRHPWHHPTVSLEAHERWRGTVSLVAIVVDNAFGILRAPGPIPRIRFSALRLEPSSPAVAARAQFTAWTSPRLYDASIINTTGPPGIPGTVPELYFGYAFAVIMLMAWGAAVWRKGRRSSELLSFAAAGLLGAHVIASIPMWRDLAANTTDAYRNYSGYSDPLNAVPEVHLYDLAKRVRNSTADQNARIFVASEQQFTRQRMNYFLAPMNSAPFFESSYRLTRAKPPADSGDYVLVFKDARMDWAEAERVLSTPWHSYTAVRIWQDPRASLFKVTGVLR